MIFLAHHGIQGQKWGVRNGPPYPLGAGAKSASEKRAEQESSNRGYSGSELGQKLANKVLAMTGNQKTGVAAEIAIYAAVNIAPLIAYFGIMIYATKKGQKVEEDEAKERFENRKPKHIEELPKLDKSMPPEENMKLTNPGFPDYGHTLNCTFCTTAMVMREKGYDVQAKTTDHGWYTDRFWERTFGIEKQTNMKARTAKDVVETLRSNGQGAYGNISVYWKMGGGHSIFWKNDENGDPHIYDGQSGEEYELASYSKLFRAMNISDTTYSRLDDKDPTEYVLAFVEPRDQQEKKEAA